MNLIRPILAAFTCLALPASGLLAQDKPAAPGARTTESFETVNKEFLAARNAYITKNEAARAEAKKNGKEKDFKPDKEFPRFVFSPRFLAIAERNPEGPEAIDALKMTLQFSGGPDSGSAMETRAKAVKILQDYYATKPSIKGLLGLLTSFDDDNSKALVADVIARNPDRKVQAAACKELIARRKRIAGFIEAVKDPKRLAAIEKARGKDFVKEQLAKAEKAKSELDGLRKTVREKFSDLVADLSIGAKMPQLLSEDLEGKTATLDDLKGKVVVLDIWATFCGPCKAMIPHERTLVARLKDKPFALVGISFDAEKKTLTDFLAKESMPWTHWWNGPEGKLSDMLDIGHFPTIFVLDPQGVIRYKEIRGEELEKAVNALLDEATAKGVKTARTTTNQR